MSENRFSLIRPVSFRDQVVEQVRTAIIEGRLKPNDHITEMELTAELGVSRTPVREALILLQSEGLILLTPHRGAFVRAFDEKAAAEIFSSRITLENFAAELVMNQLGPADYDHLTTLNERLRAAMDQRDFKRIRSTDMEFHQYLIERSGHSWLIRSWNELVAQIAALLFIRAEGTNYDEYRALQDHNTIIQALHARDLATLTAIHRQINERVAAEVVGAMQRLGERKQAGEE
jgi:DNA-binding GntR family transcriptional regulator